jgi:hypothetical protein
MAAPAERVRSQGGALNQFDLIPDLHTVANGDAPKDHPHLILPALLQKAAIDHSPSEKQLAAAHEIIKKWADLESSQKLQRMNETQLEGEFCTEVFGQALGYALFSENADRAYQWEFQPKYPVNGGTADAAIGVFRAGGADPPRALIELKGPLVNVDRDRSGGRTAVQQCWDYLNAVPDCPWGIVCNYVSFRLYHRSKRPREFELFTLQDLRRMDEFRRFYVLFGHDGLLPATRAHPALADRLLDETGDEQRKVGDELYKDYDEQRRELIGLLMRRPHRKSLDAAIRIAQKLIDRIIFVAFCEDRGLLPEKCIEKTWATIPHLTKVTNPRWRNFVELFQTLDAGKPEDDIPPFNGGLFERDDEVDDLALLPDDRTDFFKRIGGFNFRDAVNVDVLGHLFERSINALQRLRKGGLFGERLPAEAPKMARSAERKRGGIYYTPPEFTDFIVRHTVGACLRQRLAVVDRRHKVNRQEAERAPEPDARLAAYWLDSFQAIRGIKVCDPACGSGAFLIRAYLEFEHAYEDALGYALFHDPKAAERLVGQVPDIILKENLYGVDLSPQAVEITQLALWLRSARPGKSLADLSENIVCGNSLVADPAVDPQALDWRVRFADVFSRAEGGFDCVIGNPPWERMKMQEREFFDAAAPAIAAAVSAATRRRLIEELQTANPDLYAQYVAAKEAADRTLDHVRTAGNFPLTAVGDINTYAVFAELARRIVAPTGRVGLLVPSGIATDHTTRDFFGELVSASALMAVYDFENKAPVFPDVHRSYKFCILLFGGGKAKVKAVDFVFFAHQMKDLQDKDRHIALTPEDLALLNPNTRTCPVFRSRRDAELTKALYRRVPVLVNASRKTGGNPWGVRFVRMFDQTNDAELFHTAKDLAAKGLKRDGAVWKKGKDKFLPLYEAKMIQAYDHRAAGVVVDKTNWMRQGQTVQTTLVEHQNPEHPAMPRWWVAQSEVNRLFAEERPPAFLGFKDITSATNQRTMIAAMIPWSAVTNHFVLVLTSAKPRAATCLLANLNSFAYDYITRQKIGGVTLNFFVVEQVPTLPPDAYAKPCPWDKRQSLEKWISDRVLALTCTANDMKPLAEAAGFEESVHKWKDDERAELMAELDAAYFLLYAVERQDVEYILSTFRGAGRTDEGLLDDLTPAQRILQEYDRLRQDCRTSA